MRGRVGNTLMGQVSTGLGASIAASYSALSASSSSFVANMMSLSAGSTSDAGLYPSEPGGSTRISVDMPPTEDAEADPP